MTKTLICSLFLFVLPLNVFGQTNRFFTLSNVKARSLAMGGAFTAVEDDLASFEFNPAGYFLSEDVESKHIHFFLNPVSPFVGGIKNDDLFIDDNLRLDDILLSLSLLLKSFSLTLNRFQLGVLLGEESLYLPSAFSRDRLNQIAGFQQNHRHAIIGRLKLADKVSVGGTASFMFGSKPGAAEERQSDVGFSYGILLKPETGLSIGVSFVNLPDSLRQHRLPLDRMIDESVNIGISYELFTKTLFSLDLRNLGEEQQDAIREFHLGVEQIILSQVALRAGYFMKNSDEEVFSWGIGLFNGDQILRRYQEESQRNFYLNYAFVYEKSTLLSNKWHFLTFTVKI
ncbi:hypothetical protein MJD09_15545 [bacterium]|nr:hypothetical protein [bacterium]